MTIAQPILAACLGVVSLGFVAGCETKPKPDGERPGVIVPASSKGNNRGDPQVPAGASDRVLADVNGIKVTESQVMPVLIDAYGLDILLKVVQLNMAKEAVSQAGLTVSPSDVQAERTITLQLAFPEQKPEDYEELLRQLLTQQHVTNAEFEIVMQTNAHLRALTKAPSTADITEEVVRQEFNALYGQRVRIRHIALNNMQEVAEAQARLKGRPATATSPAIPPEPFEKVAREMSQAKLDRENGGLMEPFARTSGGVNEVLAQAAFSLKPGEVSPDAVNTGDFYHLIKVEGFIEPRGQKFEDVRDSVRESLIRRRQNSLMAEYRREFANIALQSLKINEPTMKKQFDDRVAAAKPKPAEKEEVRRSLDEQRERANRAATQQSGPIMLTPPAKSSATTTQPTTAP